MNGQFFNQSKTDDHTHTQYTHNTTTSASSASFSKTLQFNRVSVTKEDTSGQMRGISGQIKGTSAQMHGTSAQITGITGQVKGAASAARSSISEQIPKIAPDFSKDALEQSSERDLYALKLWLFSENMRIANEKKSMQEMQNRFIKERKQFQDEMKVLNETILQSRKKLKQDEQFFNKKMQILQNGFMELDMDKKRLAREREELKELQYQQSKKQADMKTDTTLLFAGVHNPLALKKRYCDLLKIYHPDNIAGDSSVVLYINQEYERLSKQM